ncbi:MAG: hypothetical protein JW924_14575 [Fusobacteriaceae bacterium]|nr:hypothetical protein [Fusobacteriaceae bacterium]
MKDQIKNKNLVFPWDIKGYIKLNNNTKNKILNFLIKKYRFNSEITRALYVPDYWLYNFKKSSKIDTIKFKKIVDLVKNKNLIKSIVQFNDDKGSSSIPFKGKFPINYSPLWHFVFCLSIGDGHIKNGNKKQFYWYQKPEGLKALIKIINKMNFYYSPRIYNCKRGICLPQLIRKLGSFVTGLKTGEDIKKRIINISSKLGREYQIALLMAFFLDEAGMSKPKTSEITLHQENNLIFLKNIEKILKEFGIEYARNKKGDRWVIRFKTPGIIKLAELFKSIKRNNITLLHRQKTFQKKVQIAKKTNYKFPLKLESKKVHDYLLNKYAGKIITLEQIRKHYKSNHNIHTRSLKLIEDMKKKGELIRIGLAKYQVGGNNNES